MFKKLLAETKAIEHSSKPSLTSRPTTPTRFPLSDILPFRKDQISRSPLKNLQLYQKRNQYLTNYLQRRSPSPLKSPRRSPSPLIRKNTEPIPNNRSPLKILIGLNRETSESRMPQSCCVLKNCIDSNSWKDSTKTNLKFFTTIVKDQNIKSENCGNPKTRNNQKDTTTFTSLIKKQQSLGMKVQAKQNQQLSVRQQKKQKGSLTTADFSSGKKTKLSFKDSFKDVSILAPIQESLKMPQIILVRQPIMNDSIGSISKNDRVNESFMNDSIMDLNMDPFFDM